MLVISIVALIVSQTITVHANDRQTQISNKAYWGCVEIGLLYNISPELLMAIVETESNGDKYAKNGTCKGLMQVSVKWHKDRMEKLAVINIYDEYSNILVATDYLRELIDKYGDIRYVLDVYNGNSQAKYNHEHNITSEYSRKVITRAYELLKLNGCKEKILWKEEQTA